MYTLDQKHKKHSGSLYAVAFSSKLNLLFTGGADKIVASWNLETKENTPLSIKTDSAILNLRFLNDEKHLFIGLFNGNFHIIDIESRKEKKFFPYHKSGVFATSYNEAKNFLFVGAGDGTVSIWDTTKFELLKNYKLAEGKIRAIQNVEDAVFIGTSEGQIYRVDLADLGTAELFSTVDNPIYCLSYHPMKKALLVGDKNAHLSVVNLESKKVVLSLPGHNWPIYAIEWLGDDEFATCSRDKIVKIWDGTSLEVKQRLSFPEHKGHLNSINNLQSIPLRNSLASVGDDKQICIWSKS